MNPLRIRRWIGVGLLTFLAGCASEPPAPPLLGDELVEVVAEPEVVAAEPAPQIPTQLEPVGVDPDLGFQRRLAAIPQTIAANAARLTDPTLGRQMRFGGARPAGTASQAAPGRRWEIQFFKGNTMETYARQLDFFGAEIGALEPDGKIVYAFNFSKQKPDTRTAPADAEKRFYLTWSRGDLINADRGLLAQSGTKADAKVVLLFLPVEIESALADMERAHAADKAGAIDRTRFAVRRKGDAYELYVLEQTYRQQPGKLP